MIALFTFVLTMLAASVASATAISVTPHEEYSSSVGVLDCKINTNCVAYWPGAVDCTKICVRVTYNGRYIDLLCIDQSGGAYDIFYNAWNYRGYMTGGKLAFSAANSMNFISHCLEKPDSWVAKSHELRNIHDPVCHWGYDEPCTLNLATVNNQPKCSPHDLSAIGPRMPDTVKNIEYSSGKEVFAF
ncbi:hypothetical protein N0V88_007301 [Collariella sp. IMI 366227]|nr:hypothetical protein N0V88_007301 [Collariella sp. IMI 366227]